MTQRIIAPVNAVTPNGLLKNISITLEDGCITALTPLATPAIDPLPLAIPAFIDLHIHGTQGFGPELGTSEALLQMSSVLAQQGVVAFCPTLYCAQPTKMATLLRALAPAIGQETGARIWGFHLEGPFISPEKPGVMNPQDIAPANLEDLKQLYEAAQGHITVMTLAPELPGIDPILEFCHAHHILVQAGHTNATYEQMQLAFEKGVRRVTHLGNAMSGLHHRAPGAVGAVLANPNISCEVIADGKHIHPALLTILRAIKPLAQITAVTDALLPTGLQQGPFYANGDEVTLQEGVWKRAKDGVTAGSALTMIKAFQQLIRAGYSPEQAVQCTSTNQANLLGKLPPTLQPGVSAHFVILNANGELKEVIG